MAAKCFGKTRQSKNKRTVFPLPSESAYREWSRLIKASTGEEPGIAPNCLGSSFWQMLSRIHSALNDFKTLDSVAVRNIGLMSLLMSCTGWDLVLG